MLPHPDPNPPDDPPRSRHRRSEILVAIAMGIVVTVLSLSQLFAGEDIGLHNNGDGGRLWCHFGREVPWGEDFTFTLNEGTATACGYDPVQYKWAFPSSMDPMIRTAFGVDDIATGSTEQFDLRTLGILGSLTLGAIAAAAILVFPGPLAARTAVVGLTMALWLDIGFLSYLNSYYSEAAGFIGGAALLVALAAHVRWPGVISTAAVVSAALVASMAKPQTLSLLAPLIVVLIAAPWLSRAPRRSMIASAVGSGFLVVAAFVYMSFYGNIYEEINAYDTVFTAILVESDDLAGDLDALGLPQSLAPYVGTGYWPQDRSAKNHPDYDVFLEKASRSWTTVFIVTHPRILGRLTKQAVDSIAGFRPPYLGNYESKTGIADRPEPTTWILRAMRPAILWLPLLWLSAIIGGVGSAWRWRRSESIRTWGLIAMFTGGAAALSAVAVPFGAGYYELEKHLVFAAWWTAPLLVGAAAIIVIGCVYLYKSQRASASAPRP